MTPLASIDGNKRSGIIKGKDTYGVQMWPISPHMVDLANTGSGVKRDGGREGRAFGGILIVPFRA